MEQPQPSASASELVHQAADSVLRNCLSYVTPARTAGPTRPMNQAASEREEAWLEGRTSCSNKIKVGCWANPCTPTTAARSQGRGRHSGFPQINHIFFQKLGSKGSRQGSLSTAAPLGPAPQTAGKKIPLQNPTRWEHVKNCR